MSRTALFACIFGLTPFVAYSNTPDSTALSVAGDAEDGAWVRDSRGNVRPLQSATGAWEFEKVDAEGRVYNQAGEIIDTTLSPSYNVGNEELFDEPTKQDAAASSSVLNVGSYARSVNFRTVGALNYNCSGILVAPRIVLTAGSCVYKNGQWLKGKFVPAMKSDGTGPYSYAVSTSAMYYPSWVEDGNYNNDLALFYLDRPIGAIVGTRPWSSDYSDEEFDEQSGWPFRHYGYSGYTFYEVNAPLTEDLFDDDIDTYQVDVAMGSYFSLPGMTGAPLAFWSCIKDGGSTYCQSGPNIVAAVLSRFGKEGYDMVDEICDHAWCGYNTRITANKSNDIANYIKTAGPAYTTYDYLPLYLHIGGSSSDFATSSSTTATWAKGSAYQVCYLLHNTSSFSGAGVPVKLDFRWSDNETISTSDKQIFNPPLSGAIDLASLQTKRYCTTVSVPGEAVAGEIYYLGVIATVSGDYSSGNNTTSSRDVLKVSVKNP